MSGNAYKGQPEFVVEDQSATIALLRAAETHGGASVSRIDTHGAVVFIAGERVYKLKRAVKFSFMDFSTCAKRRAACLNEVRLNRRTAPDLYLGVTPVRADAGGNLSLGPLVTDPEALDVVEGDEGTDGAIRDWVVVMQRFDGDGLFDRQARDGRLTEEKLEDLARVIADFHGAAETVSRDGDAAGEFAAIVRQNIDDLREHDAITRNRLAVLEERCEAALDRHADLLDRRASAGFRRRCHGDLHLGNVCEVAGRPTLFDCIEFNDAFAEIDTLYDLAFLLMDLMHGDRRGDMQVGANRVLNAYLERLPENMEGLALLPIFLSARAQIRAKVGLAAADLCDERDEAERRRDEALDYFQAACRFLVPEQNALIAVGGLSGSGKSTLAKVLAPLVGAVPGAVVLRSDAIRKRRFDWPPTELLPAYAYASDVSKDVYIELENLAIEGVAAGHTVIADATFQRVEGRARLVEVARRVGVPFIGFWLSASTEVMQARVAARQGDVSDATAEVVARQVRTGDTPGESEEGWVRLEAEGSMDAVRDGALTHLRRQGIVRQESGDR